MGHLYKLETRKVKGIYVENKQRNLHEFNLRYVLNIMVSQGAVLEEIYPEHSYKFIPPYSIIGS